jgi:hypothetical protein
MIVNTDSRLETFIKSQKGPNLARDKVTLKKAANAQKKADDLVNNLVQRREKIETRSAFMNSHKPTVSGSAPIPDPDDTDMLGRPVFSERQVEMRKPTSVYNMVESELPNIAPGLVPARLKAIKQVAPSHDKILHERLGTFLDSIKERRRFVAPSEPAIIDSSFRGHSPERAIGRKRVYYGSSASRAGSVSSVSHGEGVLTPLSKQQRDAISKRTTAAPRGIPQTVWNAHGRYYKLRDQDIADAKRDGSWPAEKTRDWLMEREKKAHRLYRERKREGNPYSGIQAARAAATKEHRGRSSPGTPAPGTPGPSRVDPVRGRGATYTPRGR